MLAVDRRKMIVNLLNKRSSVLVLDLAKEFDVTPETIRGDLEKLERQGVLVRTYGGATLIQGQSGEIPAMEREIINSQGKQKIGAYAASLVKDGDTIFLDASTSSLYVAKNIKEKKSVTVITNSERIIQEIINTNLHVICIGGKLNPTNMSYVGRTSEETILNHYFANKCFVSCRGVTLTRGLMDTNELEAEVKKAMTQRSESTIFLCDKTKLGKIGVPVVTTLDKVDCIISDIPLDEHWTRVLEEYDIEIITTTQNCIKEDESKA